MVQRTMKGRLNPINKITTPQDATKEQREIKSH